MNLLKCVDMRRRLSSFALGRKLFTYLVFSTILPPDLKSELRILAAYFWKLCGPRVEVKKIITCFKYWFTYWKFWFNSDVEYQLNVIAFSVVIRVLIKWIPGYLTTEHSHFLECPSTEVSHTKIADQSS